MKRILCACLVCLLLLSACSESEELPPDLMVGGSGGFGEYEFDFSVERLSGWPDGEWDFVYTYRGERICDGYRICFPLEIFSFQTVEVNITEIAAPQNTQSAAFPVAICHGGSGTTEITVVAANGKTVTFQIACMIKRVG